MNHMAQIEQDCTVEFEGKQFTAGGAIITDDIIIGYMSEKMNCVNTWHGDLISNTVVLWSSWRTPHSYISSHMYQVRVLYKDHWYSGRTAGGNMIVKLKRLKHQ